MKYTKSEKAWRKRYAKVSYYLREQYKSLQKKYPESAALDRYGLEDFESLKDLGPDYGMDLIKKRVRMFEEIKRSGQLSLQRHRRARSLAAQTLKERGVPVSQENLRGFFQFMDDLKARGIGSQKSSREWARTFNQAMKKGMSNEDLHQNINIWAKSIERNANYKPRLRKSPVSSKSMR